MSTCTVYVLYAFIYGGNYVFNSVIVHNLLVKTKTKLVLC